MAIGLLTAYMLDTIPGNFGYALVFLIGGALGVADMVCFAPVKEVYSQPPVKTPIFQVIRQVVKDKPFFSFMMFWTAWCFTANLSGTPSMV